MFELPLFPLNTVLFPGMPINLHIFEPRYKLMIEQCIQNDEPFGVVLIHKGTEASGPLAEPHPIGCTAQITQVERLDDGRMNILAVGGERFQIRSLNLFEPYLVGTVGWIRWTSRASRSSNRRGTGCARGSSAISACWRRWPKTSSSTRLACRTIRWLWPTWPQPCSRFRPTRNRHSRLPTAPLTS